MTSIAFATTPLAQRLLPFLKWWPRIDRPTLRSDAIAALVGAVLVLPQGVAFATLAGLPPEYGLYCAMIPAAVAALWGSSWHAVTGPTNAVSLVVFATLSPLAAPGSAQYVSLALTLAFMSGMLMLAMGVFRLGALVNFVSHSVVVGFTTGVGCLIFASQMNLFFGVEAPRSSSFFQMLAAFLSSLDEIQPWVALVGVVTVASGVLSRRFAPRMPYMIVALLCGSVSAWLLIGAVGAERADLRMLQALPANLPPLSYPEFSIQTMQSLLGIAISVTVLSITEAMSIGKAIALKSGQRIDANQELVGQGLANLAASFFSSYPAAASFNRSAANYEAGGRTPLAAVLGAVFLAGIVVLVAPLAAYLPLVSMAGLLFLVAASLIDFSQIRHILATSRSDATVLVLTLAATLLLSLEIAILVGVMTSLVLYLNRTSHPTLRSIVPDPRHSQRKVTEVEPGLAECPQLKLLRIEGSIYFGAINHVEVYLETLREKSPEQKHLLLMSKSINFVDLAGAETLAREAGRRRAEGGAMYFYSLRKPLEELLMRGGYMESIGRENVFRGKHEAISAVFARLDRSICSRCRARIFLECRTLPEPVDD